MRYVCNRLSRSTKPDSDVQKFCRYHKCWDCNNSSAWLYKKEIFPFIIFVENKSFHFPMRSIICMYLCTCTHETQHTNSCANKIDLTVENHVYTCTVTQHTDTHFHCPRPQQHLKLSIWYRESAKCLLSRNLFLSATLWTVPFWSV